MAGEGAEIQGTRVQGRQWLPVDDSIHFEIFCEHHFCHSKTALVAFVDVFVDVVALVVVFWGDFAAAFAGVE